ncbi:MAG TPA: outer membrane beta-barrel protein [Spirochaetota bacterium]|mgnify:CR=1 FL=1|nr:outer membrane beta-barrel protein [Spirochaetota bacterium]
MRPLIIFLIIISASSPLFSAGRYTVGVGGGYGVNGIIDSGFFKWENEGCYRVELSLEKNVSPHITFETGLWYTSHSFQFYEIEDSSESIDIKTNNRSEYLQIPLLFKPGIPFKHTKISFPVGLNFGYLINSEIGDDYESSVQEYVNSNTVSAIAGLEFAVNFSFSTDIYLGVLAEMQLVDYIKNRGEKEEDEYSYLYDMIFRSGVRYRFR